MANNLIINGVMFAPQIQKKYWKVLEHKVTKKGKKKIISIRRKSDGEIFTIGDNLALSWYETFCRPHVLTSFFIRDGMLFAVYNNDSMWEIGNIRKVTNDEIHQAMERHIEKNKQPLK